jgi:SAM-dependent methyltransferase
MIVGAVRCAAEGWMSIKTHDYEKQAGAFAELEMQGTQYLAFRDIPMLIREYAGSVASVLDYGCGAGRSTRFLKRLGFNAIGVDVSQDMLEQARSKDGSGEYRHIPSGLLPFEDSAFDLVFSSFVFLEVSRIEEIERILKEMKRVLRKDGTIIFVTSSTEAPTGNWVSLSYAFPENDKPLKSGDTIKLLIQGVDVVFHDYFWTDEDYSGAAERAGLSLAKLHKPLGSHDDPIDWRDETKMSPIAIFVLRNSSLTS